MGFKVWGLGLGVWGVGLRVEGLRFGACRVRSDLPEANAFSECTNRTIIEYIYRTRFGFRVSGFGFWVSISGFRASGSGFGVPSFGFRISGSGLRISGVGFEVARKNEWRLKT